MQKECGEGDGFDDVWRLVGTAVLSRPLTKRMTFACLRLSEVNKRETAKAYFNYSWLRRQRAEDSDALPTLLLRLRGGKFALVMLKAGRNIDDVLARGGEIHCGHEGGAIGRRFPFVPAQHMGTARIVVC